MKKSILKLLFLLSVLCLSTLSFAELKAQATKASAKGTLFCRVGLEYQFSPKGNGGTSRPVILTVEPSSPADEAGLKPGDIIESLNGKLTANMNEAAINALLLSKEHPGTAIDLEVSNFGYKKAVRSLTPYCIGRERLDESMLVDAFSLYSLEDASSRIVVYPFNTVGDDIANYEDVRYYTFSSSSSKATGTDDASIIKTISEELKAKALRTNAAEPDMIIDYYYTVARNPHYQAEVANNNAKKTSLRYNPSKKNLVELPILEVGADKRLAPYVLTFGLRFFSAKNSDSILWNCEAVEYLTSELSVGEYARFAAPVMLMQFPFVRYDTNMRLRVVDKRFNYTGIIFDNADLGLIAQVAIGSPAEKAGLKAGDRITAINDKPIASIEALTTAYRDFVKETLRYRDEASIYTDRKGLKNCRYWSVPDYEKLAKQFAKEKYKTLFSYLFAFRPYIGSSTSSQEVNLDLVKDGVMTRLAIEPILLNASYVSID